MSEEPWVGDRVRVTYEGVVGFVYEVERAVRIDLGDETCHWHYKDLSKGVLEILERAEPRAANSS